MIANLEMPDLGNWVRRNPVLTILVNPENLENPV
jgi:hypothetical protein